jgi:hypothetical protein
LLKAIVAAANRILAARPECGSRLISSAETTPTI